MTVKQGIISELNNLGILIDDSEEDADFISMGMDSITYISFIVALEERYRIQIPDEHLAMENATTINGLANLIEEIQKK